MPRDGTVPTETVALDGIIGDLRGQLGRFDKLKEAKQRLARYLGDLTASQSQ